MKLITHAWLIALKDLKLFRTDRLALSFALLFPFFFVVLFNFVLSDVGSEDNRLEFHLVTQEAEGGLSYDIIRAMETKDEAQLRPGEPVIIWDKDYDEVYQMVENKEIGGFLSFPVNFSEGVLMGYGTVIEVVTDTEATETRAALNGLAQTIASRVGSQQVAANAAIGLLVEQSIESGDFSEIEQSIQQLFSDQGGVATEQTLVEFDRDKIGEVEPYNPNNHVLSGYLVMFVFFVAALSAEKIVRERQNNTLERLLASSVKRVSILGGIFAGTAAKGLIQISIFWAIGLLILNIDLGLSPAAVIILSVLVVIMSSAFGVMLATLVRTQRSAGAIAVLTSLALAPLGGSWWPLFIVPKWMQFLAKLTPHGWANTGFNKLLVFGADFSAVIPEMLVLIGFTAVFGIIAVWRFRTSAV
ncbi:ABC transporter permease [Chloroflexota bacterium]